MKDLFLDFSGVSFESWKAQIIKDLKGINFEELIKADENGLPIFPFYNKENTVDSVPDFPSNPDWTVTQTFPVSNERATNKEVLKALSSGVEGVVFNLGEQKFCNYEMLLKEVDLPYIQTAFQVDYPAATLVYQFKDYLQNAYPDKNLTECRFRYDPIDKYLQQPDTYLKPGKEDYLDFFKSAGGFFQVFVNATLYQNAGANTVFQLGLVLAHLNEYIEFLKAVEKPERRIEICIQVANGTLFFEEIAKIRAMRKLIALLLEEHQINAKVIISAVSSNIYRSPMDAYTNLLRDTLSGMAGVLGGCDTLEIYAFDASRQDKKHSEFGAHLARNQQLIFKEESYLNKVADVSSGSFFIEKRTEELAIEGWKRFQGIEAKGGLMVSYEAGWLREQIKQQAQQLIQQYKDGNRILIGVNKYLNPLEEKARPTPEMVSEKGIRTINLAKEIL